MNRVHYNDQIKIQRLKTTSGNKRAFVATATADASIQTLGRDRIGIQDGVFGSSFNAFVDEYIDIKVGDRVVNRNGDIYSVTEVVLRDYGAFPYKELILKKSK